MANPWDNDPIVRTRKDPRINEREQAETRYRNLTGDTNPLAQPVILPGEEGYAGEGKYLPQADVVVRGDVPWANDRPVGEWEGAVAQRANPIEAFAASAAEQIPFLDEAAALGAALLTGESYERTRETERAAWAADREQQGLARNVGGVAGFATGLAAPGAAYVRGAQGAGRIGRAAAVGAGYGGLYGAGAGEDTYGSRLSGLAGGAAIGGVTAGAAQAASPYIARGAGAVSRGVRSIFNPSGAIRARGAVTPEMSAATRLEPFVTPEAMAERARLQELGVNPSVMDVTGGTSERLVRTAAGPAGPGAELMVDASVRRQANLRPEVIGVTRQLSDDPRTASQVQEGLLETRSRLADEMYPEAYQTRVPVGEDVLRALSDEPGRAALRRARAAAVARQDAEQVAEIDGLLSGEVQEVAAGTLDRIRIAMSGRARAMQQRPDTRDIASGLFGREAQIDAALEGVEQLAPARATYRNLTQAADAIESAPDVLTTAPEDYARWIAGASPEVREAAIIGARQNIMDTLGRQANAGSRSLDNISQANYAQENLASLLGPEEARRYIDQIVARVQGAQRFNRASPNTNSQTFGRLADEQAMGAAEVVGAGADVVRGAVGDVGAIARTIDRIRARATMSPAEREAIVRLGIGSADELERIVALADQARALRRPPPREVRAWVLNARNVLGPNNPAFQDVQRLLLPAVSPAQGQETQP